MVSIVKCPTDFIYFEQTNSCYLFSSPTHEKTFWYYAKSICEALSSTLLTIDSEIENSYVLSLIGTSDPWIGYYRPNGLNNAFRWIRPQSTDTYTNWDISQPIITSTSVQQCVEFSGGRLGKWSTRDCYNQTSFICEANVITLSPTALPTQSFSPTTSLPSISASPTQKPSRIPNSHCHADFVYNPANNRCYYLSTTVHTFDTAEYYCSSQFGGHLCTLNTVNTNQFINGFIQTELPVISEIWIGLFKHNNSTSFQWTNSSAPVLYTNWAPNEPRINFLSSNNKLCVKMNTTTQSWSIADCNDSHYFICETAILPVYTPAYLPTALPISNHNDNNMIILTYSESISLLVSIIVMLVLLCGYHNRLTLLWYCKVKLSRVEPVTALGAEYFMSGVEVSAIPAPSLGLSNLALRIPIKVQPLSEEVPPLAYVAIKSHHIRMGGRSDKKTSKTRKTSKVGVEPEELEGKVDESQLPVAYDVCPALEACSPV